MSLLAKALENGPKKSRQGITADELEVAEAWAQGKVSKNQITKAIYDQTGKTPNVYLILAEALKELYRREHNIGDSGDGVTI